MINSESSTNKLLKPGRSTVFTKEDEDALVDHILRCSDMYYGLSSREVKMLGYEYAKRLNKNVPGWDKDKIGNTVIGRTHVLLFDF